MLRDFSKIENSHFNFIVVGGGVNGAALAWDAALKGYDVLLVEKGDFGEGASRGCFKIVHGGLRYLQHLDFSRLRSSVREQRTFRKLAPHLVKPLPFLIPCYNGFKRSQYLLEVAMTVYELLALDRNISVPEKNILPKHFSMSKEEVIKNFPGINQVGLTSGKVYYDAQMENCERLTFLFSKAASRAGAVVLNYAEFLGSNYNNNEKKLDSVSIKDTKTNKEYQVRADHIIVSAGAWTNKIVETIARSEPELSKAYDNNFESSHKENFSKGVQVVLPEISSKYGLAIESSQEDEAAVVSRGGRSFFLVPWKGKSLLGTGDYNFKGDPENLTIEESEVDSLIEETQKMYKDTKINKENVELNFGGVRTVPKQKRYESGDVIEVSRRDEIENYEKTLGIKNLTTVVGVKYTTARKLAQSAISFIEEKEYGVSRPCLTTTKNLLGGYVDGFLEEDLSEKKQCLRSILGEEATNILEENYGSEISEFLKIIEKANDISKEYRDIPLYVILELIHAKEKEMALEVDNVINSRGSICLRDFSKHNMKFELLGEIFEKV